MATRAQKPRVKVKDVSSSRVAKQAQRVKATAKYVNSNTKAGASLIDPWKPLTHNQKLFVQAYARGENMTGALVAAGFGSNSSTSYGYRLLAMPNVAKALKEAQAANALAAELSRRDVMDMLKEAYDMAKLMSEPSSMVAAAREIGKMCGYYEPKKVDITISAGQRKKIEELSDEDLFKMMEDASAEVLALEHDGESS